MVLLLVRVHCRDSLQSTEAGVLPGNRTPRSESVNNRKLIDAPPSPRSAANTTMYFNCKFQVPVTRVCRASLWHVAGCSSPSPSQLGHRQTCIYILPLCLRQHLIKVPFPQRNPFRHVFQVGRYVCQLRSFLTGHSHGHLLSVAAYQCMG